MHPREMRDAAVYARESQMRNKKNRFFLFFFFCVRVIF